MNILSEILEEYALQASAENRSEILRKMIVEHPQFASELTDFAAALAINKHMPETAFSLEDETRSRESALRNLRNFLGADEIESLIDLAKAKGMNRSKLANVLGLSVSLVQYFEKRRIEFASIPRELIKQIAGAIDSAEEAVADYLNQQPVSTANASFKSAGRPAELEPKNFAEAVREDQQLSADEKMTLLEMR